MNKNTLYDAIRGAAAAQQIYVFDGDYKSDNLAPYKAFYSNPKYAVDTILSEPNKFLYAIINENIVPDKERYPKYSHRFLSLFNFLGVIDKKKYVGLCCLDGSSLSKNVYQEIEELELSIFYDNTNYFNGTISNRKIDVSFESNNIINVRYKGKLPKKIREKVFRLKELETTMKFSNEILSFLCWSSIIGTDKGIRLTEFNKLSELIYPTLSCGNYKPYKTITRKEDNLLASFSNTFFLNEELDEFDAQIKLAADTRKIWLKTFLDYGIVLNFMLDRKDEYKRSYSQYGLEPLHISPYELDILLSELFCYRDSERKLNEVNDKLKRLKEALGIEPLIKALYNGVPIEDLI